MIGKVVRDWHAQKGFVQDVRERLVQVVVAPPPPPPRAACRRDLWGQACEAQKCTPRKRMPAPTEKSA